MRIRSGSGSGSDKVCLRLEMLEIVDPPENDTDGVTGVMAKKGKMV